VAAPAYSADECGAAGGAPAVACSNTTLNPYAAGIDYSTATGLNLTVENGIVIDRDPGRDLDGIRLMGSAGTGLLRVEIKDGASITTNGSLADGVWVETQAGSGSSIEITSGANIDVTAPNPLPADVGVGTNGLVGSIRNTSSLGGIRIHQNPDSTINIRGPEGIGIYGRNQGLGSILLESHGGISITGEFGYGMLGFNNNTLAIGDVDLELGTSGWIRIDGGQGVGLYSLNNGAGNATILSDGYIETLQPVSEAAIAYINNTSSSADARVELSNNATSITHGAQSAGARAINTGDGRAQVGNDGMVLVTGSQSRGLWVQAGDGNAVVTNTGRTEANGEYGIGIDATSNSTTARVAVGAGATVIGGWQANVAGVGPDINRPAAGVILRSAAGSVLENAGSISAGADRAIADASRWGAPLGNLSIRNSGLITGFVELAGAPGNNFTNDSGAVFDVRHFADTNGDGVRDTKRVAISDFGETSSAFDNHTGATVRLAPTIGEMIVDDTGYYVPTIGLGAVPLEASFYGLNRAGVVQGQFTNLGTFTNSGVIDLRGSAIGNTLIMTGNPAAGGAVGGGIFVSNGGELYLNTVLNAGVVGGVGSQSDVLVVDSAQLGSSATTITIDRREGSGAQTPGNGILLVEVRDEAASEAGVFALNGDYADGGQQRIIGGAYSYALFHNGVGADSADGNWYLRNVALAPTVPVYQEVPKVLIPLIELPTLKQRVGNRYWNEPSVPARNQTLFCEDDSQNYSCAVADKQATIGKDGTTVIETGAFWGRIEGSRGHYETTSASATVAAEYDTSIWRMQAGIDSLLSESEGDKLIGGITVHYGNVSGDIASAVGSGAVDAQGYGLGGTLTWYGTDGFYSDAQAQATWLSTDINSATAGRTLVDGNDGFGYALGLEFGRKIALDNSFSLTPQAQLISSRIDFDSFTDPFGAKVALLEGDSLRGRIGLAAEYENSVKTENGTMSHAGVYGIANLHNEFLDGTHVSISGFSAESRNDRLWGSLGIGGTYSWNEDKYSIYAEASTSTGLEHFGRSYEVSGTFGLRVNW